VVQKLDTGKIKACACMYTTSDQTAQKKLYSCNIQGGYVLNLVNISP